MNQIAARLAGWGKYVPAGILDNAELVERYGADDPETGERVFNFYGPNCEIVKRRTMTPESVLKTTGIEKRRVVAEDEYADDMAIQVAGEAIRRANLPADMPWRGIFVHAVHRRSAYPAIAQRIQHEFGITLTDGYAEDCSSACSGYVQQLQKVYDLMQARPGAYLAVGSDVMTRITPKDDINFDLWGDAAGASVWVPSEPGQPGSMVATDAAHLTRGVSGDVDPIEMIKEHHHEGTGSCIGHMLMPYGPNVVKFVRRHVGTSIKNLLARAGWTGGPRLTLILHQANYNILKFFPEMVAKIYDGEIASYNGISDIGNASSGSTAYGLATCLDGPDEVTANRLHIQPDERCLVIGFGSGMGIHGVAIQF